MIFLVSPIARNQRITLATFSAYVIPGLGKSLLPGCRGYVYVSSHGISFIYVLN